MGDTEYLTYEVRSYRRFAGEKKSLLRCEALLFTYFQCWPDVRKKKIPAKSAATITRALEQFVKDKYEIQILKYFDVAAWVSSRVGE